jgi:hypothetical protein
MELIAVCDSKTNTAPDFPMGWWSLARSHELQVGEVKAVSALDRDLVLYRTRSGAVRVHDAYCPHLGAHLGINGRVVGAEIVIRGTVKSPSASILNLAPFDQYTPTTASITSPASVLVGIQLDHQFLNPNEFLRFHYLM